MESIVYCIFRACGAPDAKNLKILGVKSLFFLIPLNFPEKCLIPLIRRDTPHPQGGVRHEPHVTGKSYGFKPYAGTTFSI